MPVIDGAAIKNGLEAKMAVSAMNMTYRRKLLLIENPFDSAGVSYARQKKKMFDKYHIPYELEQLPEKYDTGEIITTIDTAAKNDEYFGIFLQMPLCSGVDTATVLGRLPREKDVEGLTSSTLGAIYSGDETVVPPTARAIVVLLEESGAAISGAEAVIVNRSPVIGKPLTALLLARNATVTLCHTKTREIERHFARADILVTGVGRPGFLAGQSVKEGAVLIDASINFIDGKMCGDIETERYSDNHLITPVPGGVGPLTNLMLLRNILALYGKYWQ